MTRHESLRVLRSALFGVLIGLTAAIVLLPQISKADNRLPPAYHWSDASQPRAFMTIEDHTSASWPVLAATNEWATEPKIDMYYSYGGCGSHGRCVDVRVVNMALPCTSGSNPYQGGFFQPIFNASGDHYSAGAYIRLNSDCNRNEYDNRDRRALACEEIGHSIGMQHDFAFNNITCMGSQNIKQLYEHPRPHDFDMLNDKIYNHND